MRAVVQRVKEAQVNIGGNLYTSIGRGLLVLLGIKKGDTIDA
ncbi:MAG: D-tyrosyl-tRNA(Tyr) deacylase, partial [Nitrospirae bacterium]